MSKNNSSRIRSFRYTYSQMFFTVLSIGLIILCLNFYLKLNKAEQKALDLQQQLDNASYSEDNYKLALEKIDDLSSDLISVLNSSKKIEEQNEKLAEQNQEYYEEMLSMEEESELISEYNYALINEMGERTDITPQQIIHLQDLLEDSEVNDVDLFLAWIMTESRGETYANADGSTAKGYGQFLDGTSKWVYTQLMHQTGWYPDIAYNGDVNMELMVSYVEWLYNKYDHDLFAAMREYRGEEDISGYVASIDSYLAKKGKSVATVAATLK